MNRIKKLMAFLVVAMLVVSCSAPPTPAVTQAPPPAETEAPAQPPEPAAPETQAPAPPSTGFQEVPREQTVIFENIDGRVAIPNNMNPYISGQYLDWGMWQANQESLFYLNYETGETVPWQASGFQYNADFSELTINIREGVKWSDGEPFTAEDVVFTINMLKQNPELQYSSEMVQWVADVQAPDLQTVVFKLTSPNPRFLESFFAVRIWDTILIAPKHIWEKENPLTFTNFDLEKGLPVGTGPYRLVRSTETETVWDLRENWWAAETGFHAMPVPKRAIWIGVGTDEIRAAKAVNNELDAMWLFGRSTFESAVARNPNIIGWTKELPYAYLDPCPRFLAINNGIPPFDNPEVRWAINAAINRDEIITIAYEGMTDAAATLYPTYTNLQKFLDRNQALFAEYPTLEFNPAKTEEKMTAQGFTKDGAGYWLGQDGKRITITIITRSGEADKVKMGPVIVDQLNKAGFEADFQPLEAAVFYDDTAKGAAQAWITDICASVSDPWGAFDRFHSRNYAPIGEPAPANPEVRYQNEELTRLIDEMAVMSPEDPKFAPLADQALGIWVRDLPVIPLVQARLLTPFNNTYWTNWPSIDNNYVQPGHWWVTGNLILLNIKPAQ